MKLNTLMVATGVVNAVFGIAFVFLPAGLVSLYGITADPALKYTGQLFGAALIAWTLLMWFALDVADLNSRKAIVASLFVGYAIGLIVALIGQLNGVVNALGWLNILIYFIFTLGYGYFQFVKPTS